jgi:DNA-binding LacI/PurR family transcriptional regulator
MADVARLASVSTMTVSRVLNGHPSVTPATRRSVERAIERLGYRPNTAARALVTGRSATIGVVSVETAHYGPASTLFGIEAAARASGLFVSFVAVREVTEAQMRAAIDHLGATNVDGIVVVAPIRAARDAISRVRVDLPIVVLQGVSTDNVATVAIDQAEGSRLATRHLLDLGHRTVHHVRGPRDWLEADARAAAWTAELRDHGIRPPKQLVGDWTPRSGYEAGRRLAADPDVTAIFVANDQMALGVLLALSEAGRRVPEGVSVVGFDDIPEAAYFAPPLTTIRQDFDELGRRCVHQLLALLNGEGTPDEGGAVHPVLVKRSSTSQVSVPTELTVER